MIWKKLPDPHKIEAAAFTLGNPVSEGRSWRGTLCQNETSFFHDSRVFLEAMTEEGYARGRAAALPLCEFPATAELQASMPIYTSALNIFDYEDELIMLKDSFGDRVDEGELPAEAGEERISSKEALDAISSRIIGNYNEGIEEDDAETLLV